MNIQEFAMPTAAYSNPTVYGDLTGANRWVWTLSHVFADQKFMTIFSLLFGAGIVLMSEKLDARGQRAWGLHYRRTFWLLLIGLAHAYLLWSGDILVAYALCGFWVYWLRRLRPGWQMALGIVVVSISALILLAASLTMPPETQQEWQADWRPAAETLAEEVASYRGGWLEQMNARVPTTVDFQTYGFLFWALWRAGGLMLMGMALFRWGVLTGSCSRRFYAGMAVLGFAIGLPVVSWGVVQNFAHNWTLEYSYFGLGAQANYWGSFFISAAYIGLLMLFARSRALPWLQNALAAVGRTALSNYLLQTILATAIFYGHGLGLYGSVERVGQVGFVAAIWAFQLVVSPLWLRYYRFGPFEWLWRSLSYWRLQAMGSPSLQETRQPV
ncbi:MAG: DUF418 domain-containing protein [Caldilineaceae bacterium SB0664_bin_27]|uniref:DUF418 domain-containing protein n=1 Tax=Caldilineaceae bacterium SB0664_bin_27 TaxID=2605260 RepID=A0A6B0Z106_9CHLR|nr:DUF418 domain-containing protein [Caldilineaceae bacterium SB0664_bin_27]